MSLLASFCNGLSQDWSDVVPWGLVNHLQTLAGSNIHSESMAECMVISVTWWTLHELYFCDAIVPSNIAKIFLLQYFPYLQDYDVRIGCEHIDPVKIA